MDLADNFKTKNSTEKITSFVKKFDYTLVSEYRNNYSLMLISCDQSHTFSATWLKISKWSKKGERKFCPICRNHFKQGSKDLYLWWYGTNLGNEKYKEYLNNKKKSNSLERYIEKYGKKTGTEKYIKWKNFGISLAYYIDKYGTIVGQQKWNDYLLMHSKKRTLKNYIDRLGPIEGETEYKKFICKNRKSKTLEGFKEKYGDQLGTEKFKKFVSNSSKWGRHASRRSLEHLLPPLLCAGLQPSDIFIGTTDSKEFCLLLPSGKIYYYDCMIPEHKLIIEFNSNTWHPDPNRLKENFLSWKAPRGNINAQRKYEYDCLKIKSAIDAGYQVLVVWDEDGIDFNHKTILHLLRSNKPS